MDTTTKATATAQLLLASMAMLESDDGIDYLDNLHVLAAFPQGLRDEVEAAFALVRARGARNASDRELLLSSLVAVLASQVVDMQERLTILELAQA